MIKKIFFSLIVFSTLFIGQRVFADIPLEYVGLSSNGIYNQFQFKAPFSLPSGYSKTALYFGVSLDENSQFYHQNFTGVGSWAFQNSNNQPSPYEIGDNVTFSYDNTTSYVPNGTLWNYYGNKVQIFICKADFVSPFTFCDDNTNLETVTFSDALQNPNLYSFIVENDNGDVYVDYAPPALFSDIEDILLPDNTSLDEVTEPISAPAGLNVYFTNYEINPYQYLHINLITCTNGQNEGCNGYNETERFFNIDISNLGYSEDEDDLLLYRFNLQGLVTQNDYVSVSYKLSNCDYNISVCPEGYSAGRSYQFLVNNALTEGTWVDFEDKEDRPDCTLARLDVCFMNAMRWLFLPTPKLVSDITSITFSDRIPFSYIYDLDDLYQEAFNDTPKDIDISIAFGSFGNITLLSTEKLEAIPFQGTVRTIMGAILIFGTVMLIYRKVLTINDKREVVEKQ